MLEPLLNSLNNMRVILATTSIPRQELLRSTNLKFEIMASDFEENLPKDKYTFSEYVEETALHKVEAVHNKLLVKGQKADVIIGLDTMISYDGSMFGKAKSNEDAKKTLKMITGKGQPHFVITGVAIKYREKLIKFSEVTSVHLAKLTDEEIDAYVNTGEPIGKAGAYAIQGLAKSFVKRIEGDYHNIVGIPLYKIAKHLKKLVKDDLKQ